MYDDPKKKKEAPPDPVADFYKRLTEVKQPAAVTVPDDDDGSNVARVVDDEFAKLGYGSTQRLSILGDVGRENAWNRGTIFKGHVDPASYTKGRGKIENRGIISWNGPRREKLNAHLQQEGVLGKGDDDELRGMVRFMDKEMREDYPQVYNKLRGAGSTAEASEALRQYIRYSPKAPYNSPDPNFVTKNNAEWAKKARALGLAADGGAAAPIPAAPPFDPEAFKRGILGSKLPTITPPAGQPVPEEPFTLDAQRKAMNDQKSTRAGVLYGKADKIPEIKDSETDLPLPSGEILRVNKAKLDAASRAAGRDLADDVMKGGDYTMLIGGKAQPTRVTGGKVGVVTRDKRTGKEVVASTVETPDAVAKEAALQKAQFPNRETTTEVATSDQIAGERQAAIEKRYADWRVENKLEKIPETEEEMQQVFDAWRTKKGLPPVPQTEEEMQAAFAAWLAQHPELPRSPEVVDQFNEEFKTERANEAAEFNNEFKAARQTEIDQFNKILTGEQEQQAGIDTLERVGKSIAKGELAPEANYARFLETNGLTDSDESRAKFSTHIDTQNAAIKKRNAEIQKLQKRQQQQIRMGRTPEAKGGGGEIPVYDFERTKKFVVPPSMGQEAIEYDYDPEKQKDLRKGEYRVVKDGTSFIVNPELQTFADEAGTQIVKDIELPLSERGSMAAPVARRLQANVIAEAVAADYGKDIPKDDVIDYFERYGVTDWETKKELSPDRFFFDPDKADPVTGLTKDTDTFHLTQLDVNRMLAFSKERARTKQLYEEAKGKYAAAGEDPVTADVYAARDAGWMTKSDADEELAAYREQYDRAKSAESSRIRHPEGGEVRLQGAELENFVQSQLAEIRQKYGSFKAVADEEKRIDALPLGTKIAETAGSLVRVIPHGIGMVLKTAGAVQYGINNLFTNIPAEEYQKIQDTGLYQMGEAYQWLGEKIPSDPDARKSWAPKIADTIGQVGVAAGLTWATGGIGAASVFGLSQGAGGALDQAIKDGATPNQQLALGVIGAVAAVPDILLMRGWFKNMTGGEKTGIVRGIGQSIFTRLVGKVGTVEAEAIAKKGMSAFIERATQLGEKILFNVEKESFKPLTAGYAAKTLAKESLLKEGPQEVSENKINLIGQKFINKPEIGWKDILKITDEDVESYALGSVGGGFGATIQIATHPDAFKGFKERRAANALINESFSEDNIVYRDGKKSFTIAGKTFEVTPEVEELLTQYQSRQADLKSNAEKLRDLPKRVKNAESFTQKKELVTEAKALRDETLKLSDERADLASQIIEQSGAAETLVNATNTLTVSGVAVPAATDEVLMQGVRGTLEGSFDPEAFKAQMLGTAPAAPVAEPAAAPVERQLTPKEAVAVGSTVVLPDGTKATVTADTGKGLKLKTVSGKTTQRDKAKLKILETPVAEKPTSIEEPKEATAAEKGFEIVAEGKPTPTTAAGQLKEQRDVAKRAAETDTLTGVASRAAYNKALPAAEADPKTKIVSFDANNFGKINKELGETAGDKALVGIADAIKQAADEHGVTRVFRKGGDEFVVMAPAEKADAIRARAEEIYGDQKIGATTVSLTGSVGNTFEEANAPLQEAKATRKAAQAKAAEPKKPKTMAAAAGGRAQSLLGEEEEEAGQPTKKISPQVRAVTSGERAEKGLPTEEEDFPQKVATHNGSKIYFEEGDSRVYVLAIEGEDSQALRDWMQDQWSGGRQIEWGDVGQPSKQVAPKSKGAAVSGVEILGTKKLERQPNAQQVVSEIEKRFQRVNDKPIDEMSDKEIVDSISAHLREELKWWLKNRGDYKGFYTDDRIEANKELQDWAKKEHGRELTDDEVSLYHLVSAFGSPSANPIQDSSLGLTILDKYLRTGKLTSISDKIGTIWANIKGKKADTLQLKFSEEGDPIYSQVSRAYQTKNLIAFNKLMRTFEGSKEEKLSAAIAWLQSEHSAKEIQKKLKLAKPPTPSEYMSKEGGYGIFGLTGTKLGSYFLNRTGNLDTITKDLWYARSMARYFGMPLTQTKGGQTVPLQSPWSDQTISGVRYRKLADEAFARIGKEFKMTPAEVQQGLWDFEKRLWEHLGHPAQERVFITDGLDVGKKLVDEAKGAPPLKSATIGVAPTRVGTIKKLRGAGKSFAAKPYQQLLKTHKSLVKALDLTVNNLSQTVGAFGATSSDFEASFLPTVSGSAPDVELYAALMATLAPDIQHSALISTYKTKADGAKDVEHRITFKTKEAAEEFVADRNAVGISDLSFDPTTKTAILLSIDRYGGLDLTALYEQYGQDIENHELRNADIQFVEEADYGRAVREARSALPRHDGTARREKLSPLLDTAEAKLRKAKLWEPADVGQPSKSVKPETATAAGTKELRDTGGVRGSAGVLADPYRENSGYRLEGAEKPIQVGDRLIHFTGFKPAQDLAVSFMEGTGRPYTPNTKFVPLDKEMATKIANEFEKMQHDPQNPEVRAAYDAMIKETIEQYKAIIATGLKVEFIDYAKTGDPYNQSPRDTILDVVENNHLWVFSTRDGFGSDETFDPIDNPLLQETEFKISGQVALANDLFRVVHDYFGHIKDGNGFRARGEENAWDSHARMYSPLARRAMTTETRGQNSWVNFGPHGETNRTASGADTVYADQKIGLLPEEMSEPEDVGAPLKSVRSIEPSWLPKSEVQHIVWHGGSSDIDIYDPKFSTDGVIHFGDTEEDAAEFAEIKGQAGVNAAFVNITNNGADRYQELTSGKFGTYKAVYDQLRKEGYDGVTGLGEHIVFSGDQVQVVPVEDARRWEREEYGEDVEQPTKSVKPKAKPTGEEVMHWGAFSDYLVSLPLKDTYGKLTPYEKKEIGGATEWWKLQTVDPDTLEPTNEVPTKKMAIIVVDDDVLDGRRRRDAAIERGEKSISAWVGYDKKPTIEEPVLKKVAPAERLAPNGKPSNLNAHLYDLVRTPEFKKWFGDWEAAHNGKDQNGVWSHDDVSKIVDENGEPLVVYHGTTQGGFDVFDPDRGGKVKGATFFTKDRNTARSYSGAGDDIQIADDDYIAAWWNDEGGANEETPWSELSDREKASARQEYTDNAMTEQRGIYPTFLNIRNPYESSFEGANWDGSREFMYMAQNEDGENLYDDNGRGYFADEADAQAVADAQGGEVMPADDHYETTDSAAREGQKHGHDGAFIHDVQDPGQFGDFGDVTDVFVVNSPTQIKSIYNRGTFSPEEESILKKTKTAATIALRTELEAKGRKALERVLGGITGGKLYDNGELEVDEHDAEIMRRLWAEREFDRTGTRPEEEPFEGIVYSPAQLNALSKFGSGKGRKMLAGAGFSEEQLANYDKLMKQLTEIAKTKPKEHTIAFVYETALPHERVHKQEREAGGTTAKGLAELKKSPFWNTKGTAFDEAYGNASEKDKASELAAILASGEAAEYGLDQIPNFEEEKAKFLSTWARDIVENNAEAIARLGAEEWERKFYAIAQHAKVTQYETETRTADEGAGEVSEEAEEPAPAPLEGGEAAGEAVEAEAPAAGEIQTAAQPTEAESKPDTEPAGRRLKKDEPALSTHYEKVRSEFEDIFGEEYTPTTLAKQAVDAEAFIKSNRKRAMRVAYGLEDPPTGLFRASVAIMMSRSLKAAGKMAEARDVARRASKMITAAAQELNVAKMDLGSPMHLERTIEQKRLERLGKSLNMKPEEAFAEGKKKVKEAAAKAAKEVTKEAKSITSAKKLLDMLTCK